MMIKEMNKLLTNYIEKNDLEKIINNYEQYKSYTLLQLGIDSLDIMGLVLDIEKIYNIEIDFEKFDISDIETLEKMEKFIKIFKNGD
ncbi:MAG: acyl carrier protein [Clostridiales bacterium]|nr:acyl carrier protein [Clostridiales bacterium]